MRVLVANLPFGVIIMIPGGLYGYLRLQRQLTSTHKERLQGKKPVSAVLWWELDFPVVLAALEGRVVGTDEDEVPLEHIARQRFRVPASRSLQHRRRRPQ